MTQSVLPGQIGPEVGMQLWSREKMEHRIIILLDLDCFFAQVTMQLRALMFVGVDN